MSRTKTRTKRCESRLDVEHQGTLRRVTIRTATRVITKQVCATCRQKMALPDRDVTLTPSRSNPR